jgi:hypothetical protein
MVRQTPIRPIRKTPALQEFFICALRWKRFEPHAWYKMKKAPTRKTETAFVLQELSLFSSMEDRHGNRTMPMPDILLNMMYILIIAPES